MILDTCITPTPIGGLLLVGRGETLIGLEFADQDDRRATLVRSLERRLGPLTTREHPDPAGAAGRLSRYFAGDIAALDEQPCEPHGTEFQLAVWGALRTIPVGSTWSYSQLALHIG